MDTWQTVYPRPQLRRDSFFPLASHWSLNGQPIQLPWPPQAPLARFRGPMGPALYYQTTFYLPQGFYGPGQRVLLQLGAVDQTCQVVVNDQAFATHKGGYLPFAVDITDALHPRENRLALRVLDELSSQYPYGKQCAKPHGMWYTPVSGVWQPLWLEVVPATGHIRALKMTPDTGGLTLEVDTDAPAFTAEIPLPQGGVLRAEGHASQPLRLEVPAPHLWTPDDPWLYDLTVTTATDRVDSYFALRTVELLDIQGQTRLCLNGRPIFLHGVLDQGYFCDGLFLPATPDGYAADIRRMKALGFNTLRKHIKIEPELFYYACDRLGMLVLQDMVNSGPYHFVRDTLAPTLGLKRRRDDRPARNAAEQARRDFFRDHCEQTLRQLYDHPCIVGYTIFNEGWGQFEADDLYRRCKAADPTRLYDATSGWFARNSSDVQSEHVYFRTKKLRPADPRRPLLLSECGGFSRRVAGHGSDGNKNYGYGQADTEAALTARLLHMYRRMVLPAIPHGLCGCIYTQLSDVEGETNGLYTYDREVCKVEPGALQALAKEIEDFMQCSSVLAH